MCSISGALRSTKGFAGTCAAPTILNEAARSMACRRLLRRTFSLRCAATVTLATAQLFFGIGKIAMQILLRLLFAGGAFALAHGFAILQRFGIRGLRFFFGSVVLRYCTEVIRHLPTLNEVMCRTCGTFPCVI